jgi:esterase/lipase
MDEAISKYIDQIATEKLLEFKLRKVRHQPTKFYTPETYALNKNELEELVGKREAFAEVVLEQGMLSFPSCITTEYSENNRARCYCYQVENAKGEIILIHGLYEDDRQMYQYLITALNKQGLNVSLYILPFHYERKPAECLFSGEYFLSGEIFQSFVAFKQAVYDLYFLYCYLKQKQQQEVLLVGFSMGGGMSLLLSILCEDLDGLFVINPVVGFSELLWTRPLCATIKDELINYGMTYEQLKKMFLRFEPLEMGHTVIPTTPIRLIKGIYDQINDPKDYDRFTARWNIQNVISYKAGHLNILGVPRLCADILDFYSHIKTDCKS